MDASPALVGRADEFALLAEAFYGAVNGRTQTVLLEGEAGIGKTRLAEAFLSWAAEQGADTPHVRAG